MKRVAIIYNPLAGKGKARKLQKKIQEKFSTLDLDVYFFLTQFPSHAESLAKEACNKDFDIIVAAGGDGTCNEIINGMMTSNAKKIPAFGVIPIGRGNDFAYGAGIPKDIFEACELFIKQEPTFLDIGKITGGYFPNGKYFANGIGIGFDTIVGLNAAKHKKMHSAMSYMAGVLDSLIHFTPSPLISITYNGISYTYNSLQISILNGKRMGGLFHMAPDANSSDGLLNLCMAVRKMTRLDMIRLVMMYTKGTQGRDALIKTDLAPSYIIEAPNKGLVCHADGETICTDGDYLKIECINNALQFYHNPSLPRLLPSQMNT